MALRILYSGWFLGEGFRACGCEVAAFRPDAGRTLDEQVEATGFAPDLVFLEFFGDTPLPQAIHESRHRLAAYCVDSPLNEFWLLPLMRLFDHVYVDQLASVARFRRGGVPAAWLPLCVNEDHFREPRERPAHFLTFVGRTSETRVKRRNLLEHIAGRHEVRLLRDVSAGRMLDAFADSQVVLNENFFSGLNLRFLHALASGSLLLTERGGRGVERFFTDGEHFVSYDHTDILDVLDRLKRDPEAFRAVAAAGQAECRARHTSACRAASILDGLRAPSPARLSPAERGLHEAHAKYNRALRFGGNYCEAVHLLERAAGVLDDPSQALLLLGAADLRADRAGSGLPRLEQCAGLATRHGLDAAMKLLLVDSASERVFTRLARVVDLLHALGLDLRRYAKRIRLITGDGDRRFHCCLLCCDVFADLGRVFDVGFVKPEPERLPDSALECALLAFERAKTREALDAIIRCARKEGLTGEALPFINAAILEGAASDRQITQAAALALEYYDFAYAASLLASLKKRRAALAGS
ncbi:glycosyltransferase [Desulfovibrio aminophilus]|nr:glycosyltransferase [Desulfovibrio aminophilus]MCM0756874.1 glycosyltransferase [Desulfovibrio aminophilus]